MMSAVNLQYHNLLVLGNADELLKLIRTGYFCCCAATGDKEDDDDIMIGWLV